MISVHGELSKEMVALRGMNVEVKGNRGDRLLAMLKVRPTWVEQIVVAQERDPIIQRIKM